MGRVNTKYRASHLYLAPKNTGKQLRLANTSRKSKNRSRNSGSNNLTIVKSLNTRERVHQFERLTNLSLKLNQQAWFTSTGVPDICITFSLQYTKFYGGGILLYSITNPGYAEFINLFEKWRIRKVEVTPVFSANSIAINQSIHALPIMNVVVDYDDSNSLTLTQAQQYQNNQVVQLGNGAQRPPTFSLVPRAQLSTITGTAMLSPVGGMFNTQSPATELYGLKFVYDNSAVSSVIDIGVVNFYVRYYLDLAVAN